jgi:hypothetical protein
MHNRLHAELMHKWQHKLVGDISIADEFRNGEAEEANFFPACPG